MSDIYTQYGGNLYVPRIAASQPVYGSDPTSQVWGFGWIPLDDRTQEESRCADEAIREMPRFEISGRKSDDPKKAVLWDCSKKINNGQHFRTFYQKTGSCFPAGTPIRMADGSEKAIETLKVGDMVLSHTKTPRPVTKTWFRQFTGNMIAIFVDRYKTHVVVTDDHDCLIVDNETNEPRKVKAEDVYAGHQMLLPFKEGNQLASVVATIAEPVENHPVYCVTVDVEHSLIARGIAIYQCVGNGGGQATWYLSAAEVVRLRDPEQVILPFYLLPYGRSRFHAGMRGRGDGSFGSAFAKAIRTEGILPATTEGLPKWTDQGGITWGSSVEYEWSDGAAIPSKWMEMSKKHLVKTTAQLRSADDAREALRNYYPCTIASDWGGQMRPTQQGEPAVLLNRRTTTWMHQMSLQGWWDHPTLGEIFYILNSWGVDAHGQPPDDAPPGGFWVKKSEMESIIRQGDSFAFSQFDGFPAQDLSWYI